LFFILVFRATPGVIAGIVLGYFAKPKTRVFGALAVGFVPITLMGLSYISYVQGNMQLSGAKLV
jgi:uncharacterized membrane protein (Fun14 family)